MNEEFTPVTPKEIIATHALIRQGSSRAIGCGDGDRIQRYLLSQTERTVWGLPDVEEIWLIYKRRPVHG